MLSLKIDDDVRALINFCQPRIDVIYPMYCRIEDGTLSWFQEVYQVSDTGVE